MNCFLQKAEKKTYLDKKKGNVDVTQLLLCSSSEKKFQNRTKTKKILQKKKKYKEI